MNNALQTRFSKKSAIFALISVFAVGSATIATTGGRNSVQAAASEPPNEIVYCDDTVYSDTTDGEIAFQGQGAHTAVSYTIDCDEMVVLASAGIRNVPSYGNNNSEWQNVCGPVAGLNIVVFYDKYFPNLLPNFEPGAVSPSGVYRYYPDMSPDATDNALVSLYNLMDIANVGGTTEANFRSGLASFAQSRGYSLSYSSVHQNGATVNLSTFGAAMNQDKVAVVMCSQYNFIYTIRMVNGEGAYVGKINASAAHMMMAYGYQTIGFYKNGNLVTTKTFLNVCSGYSTSEIGWMELNDSAVINNALAVSIA